MKMEFLPDGPALVVEGEQRLLVVADLHFGIEADLAAHGLHIRSHSAERLERLMRTIDAAKADFLVLLGDVKHSIPSLTRQEYVEMPGILGTIRNRIPIRVFPGNHDIGIERFLDAAEILPKEGAVIDGVGYLHGHMYPSPSLSCRLIIAGHHHPLVALRDDVGCALQAPAYLRADLDTAALGLVSTEDNPAPTCVLLMPAFNEIAGYDILQIAHNPFSPLSRYMNADKAEVILADGTYIGPLRSLVGDERD